MKNENDNFIPQLEQQQQEGPSSTPKLGEQMNASPDLERIAQEAERSSKSADELGIQDDQNEQSQSQTRAKSESSVQDIVHDMLNDGRKKQGDKPLAKSDQEPQLDSNGQPLETPEDSQPPEDGDETADEKVPEEETEDEETDDQKDDSENDEEDADSKSAKEKQAAEDAKLTQEQRDAKLLEKLPLNQRTRFNEVLTENRALKQKQTAIDTDIKWRRDNNVDPETYATAMNLAALNKKDPAKFFEVIGKMHEEYQVSTGAKLPDDLQAKVTAGKMDEADAKEIAQLRIKANGGERQLKSAAQKSEEARTQQITEGLNSIGQVLQKSNPSFRPKEQLGKNVKGLWEYSMEAFALLQAREPAKNGLHAQQQFQQCYNEVLESFKALQPPRRTANRTFNRNAASRGITPSASKNKEPQSANDAVSAMLKQKHGMSYTRNGDSDNN